MNNRMKQLVQSDPNFLGAAEVRHKPKLRHFAFRRFFEGEKITMVVCGEMQPEVVRTNLARVTCPDCIAAVRRFAECESYEQAMDLAKKIAPRIFKPNPAVMKEKVGEDFTIEAKKHQFAQSMLDSKGAKDASELPALLVGSDERTFYRNMFELGLIDAEGEKTGFTVDDILAGKQPGYVTNVVEAGDQ